MKIDGRLFIVFIIALALISGACAITASTGGGSSLSGSGTAQGNLATDGIQTTGFSVANGVISGTENHWVEDTTGKHAEVGMSVDSAEKLKYSYSLSPNKDKTVVSPQSSITAKELLDVTNAYSASAYAFARNGEGDRAGVTMAVYDGSITGYANSATANTKSVQASETFKSLSGNGFTFDWGAKNSEGDYVGWYTGSEYQTLKMTESPNSNKGFAAGTQSVVTQSEKLASLSEVVPGMKNCKITAYGDKTSASVTQSIDSISSPNWYWPNSARNGEGDSVDTGMYLENGVSLRGFSESASANAKTATLSRKFASASASWIEQDSDASNAEGDIANSDVQIATKGKLSTYSGTATSTKTYVDSIVKAGSASGDSINVKSHAENRNLALEYLDSTIPTYHGGADFEVQATALTNTKLVTEATSSNVVITPTLPKSIKTAIMLEPFRNVFVNYAWLSQNGKTYYGTTDLGTTVFPDLVGKGYATLRYTDSGASSDKFQDLGQYNVVLVNSHMNSGDIGLSTINPKTKSNYLPASQLSYKTSKSTLVILAGCDSFEGYPTKSGLANAVGKAYLSGGFTQTIFVTWMQDYLSYFFEALKNDNSASYANSYAYNQAGAKWGKGNGRTPLEFYPTTGHDFKL